MTATLEAPAPTMTFVPTEEHPVSLTERAAQEVRDILEQQGGPTDLALRIYVAGGGCSGLQYGMALDESFEDGDKFFADRDIRIVVDPMSLRYITGSIVDYVTTPMGGGFKVENPNAVKSCGCGSSFSTEEDAEGKTLTGGCGSCGSHK